ncbi:hypothetical protein CHARACLAT_030440 [Characodon lateralis]|uniref:Uncharacterized protein n=1 Tax=Characodon lateralis TaxID=208331 RepID=A0ABU7DFH8_9TELE|nr:hypothetical protein [Characodon lateralis]
MLSPSRSAFCWWGGGAYAKPWAQWICLCLPSFVGTRQTGTLSAGEMARGHIRMWLRCGVSGVPGLWRAVVAFLRCFLLWLWPLAWRRVAVWWVKQVLYLHWGGWWVVLSLEWLVSPARLPGWGMFLSHGREGWGAGTGQMVGRAWLCATPLAVVSGAGIGAVGWRVRGGVAACEGCVPFLDVRLLNFESAELSWLVFFSGLSLQRR